MLQVYEYTRIYTTRCSISVGFLQIESRAFKTITHAEKRHAGSRIREGPKRFQILRGLGGSVSGSEWYSACNEM